MTHLNQTMPDDSSREGDSIETFGYAQELPRVLKLDRKSVV